MKVAHEFKNLLTTILGYTELLQRRVPVGDPLRAYVEEIAKAAERARVISAELFVMGDVPPPQRIDSDPEPAESASC